MYFKYGEKEINALKAKDKKLAEIIDKIGPIKREISPDLFSSVVHNIVAQQISAKAEQSIWRKINEALGEVNPKTISKLSLDELRKFGLSGRKVEYILEFANKVENGEVDLKSLKEMPDEEFIKELSSLRGIGEWTAEMIMLFCLGRPNVLSCKDYGILKGLRMIYRHRKITKELFKKYKNRFAPYGSIASLYIWEVAGGAIPELSDPEPKKKH